MLLQLLPLWRLGVLRFALLDIRLQLGNLFIDVRNVLFDDIGKFLYESTRERLQKQFREGNTEQTYANFDRSIIKERFALCDCMTLDISQQEPRGRAYVEPISPA